MTLCQILNVMWKHIFLNKLLIRSRVFISFIFLFIIFIEKVVVIHRGEDRDVSTAYWHSSNSTHDLKEYKNAKNFATNFIKKARSDFYENLIQENSLDERKLFKISKQLLNQSFEVPMNNHNLFYENDNKW